MPETPGTPILTLTLDHVIGHRYVDDDCGQDVTLRDAVVDELASRLRREIGDDVRKEVRTKVLNELAAEIHDQAVAVVSETLAAPIRRTNTWGDPTGPETTVRALVIDEVQAWMSKSTDRYSEGSPFRKLLAAEVDKAMKAELSETIKKARASVDQAVKASAANLIAEAVKNGGRIY